MKNVIILFLILAFPTCNSREPSSDPNKIYKLNKGKDFSDFENWTISLREGESNVWIFDYTLNNKIEARYLVISNDSLLFKNIFPIKDSVFHSLNVSCSEKQKTKDAFGLDLYLNFRALKVDAISYLQADSLFLLRKEGIVLVHTKRPTEISTVKQFVHYKKIDSYWFYSKE